jgi:hypothetical protein
MTHPDFVGAANWPGVMALKKKCPTCGAKRGKECVTKSGSQVPGWRLWSNDRTQSFRFPGTHATRIAG